MSPDRLRYVRDLLRERAGIVLDADKGYLVEARLGPLAGEQGLDIDAFVDRMRAPLGTALRDRCVEALTTNETSFFRDVAVYRMLEAEVLPRLLTARAGARRLRIWSAACSTGQEPYTLAMILEQRFPQLRDWSWEILATDLSREVLAKAEAGFFTQLEVNRGLPASLLVRCFAKEGNGWRIQDRFRRRIAFRQLNLTQPWPSHVGTMDLVLLRNVLIYFDVPTKRRILERVRGRMNDDACLVLGGAETTMNVHDGFERERLAGGTVYRRRDAATATATRRVGVA
ncbi:MAG TPA: protein-glutamate O-methyltransferase CheR [Sandaracinaceae bacterium LLY-WYZ-13_1]|nr:protein-glutamate O-methyltransferase CheR [Sandaracinaceae bacterium LLY-WYZ-13_1]